MEMIANGSGGTQVRSLPETHHINAGIPATKTRNPRIYPKAFLMVQIDYLRTQK
jgi:hypothetical protein